jgi:hypothetical protein
MSFLALVVMKKLHNSKELKFLFSSRALVVIRDLMVGKMQIALS